MIVDHFPPTICDSLLSDSGKVGQATLSSQSVPRRIEVGSGCSTDDEKVHDAAVRRGGTRRGGGEESTMFCRDLSCLSASDKGDDKIATPPDSRILSKSSRARLGAPSCRALLSRRDGSMKLGHGAAQAEIASLLPASMTYRLLSLDGACLTTA